MTTEPKLPPLILADWLEERGQSERAASIRRSESEFATESWRKVWRTGFAPGISTAGLKALREALLDDNDRLLQGATTCPPPIASVQDWPCEGSDCIGWCGWKGDGLETVGDVESYFAVCCFQADKNLGEPAACRWFLNWYDDTPRDQMRCDLLAEVERELARRSTHEAA